MFTETISIKFNERDVTPKDIIEAANFYSSSDEWNHYIYTHILEIICPSSIRVINKSVLFDEKIRKLKQRINSDTWKMRLFKKVSRLASRFYVKKSKIFLMDTSLSLKDEIALYGRLKSFPFVYDRVDPAYIEPDITLRKKISLDYTGDNEFEKIMIDLLLKQIPTAYLEGYIENMEIADGMKWPKTPKVIFTSNALYYNTIAAFYTASKVDSGGLLLHGQHGGVYGIANFSYAEDHEYRISDKYVTWGWKYNDVRDKCVPTGLLKDIAIIRRHNSNNRGECLIVLQSRKRYMSRLIGTSGINQAQSFIQQSLAFVKNINGKIYNKLIIRHHNGNHWNERERWNDEFPDLTYDDGSGDISGLIDRSRCVIYPYNSTGYLEFMAANVPVIIFWNLEEYPLRESAVKHFNELKKVGVFHDNPHSAAQHLELIWDDVDAWWNSENVKNTVKDFLYNYARTPKDLIGELGNTISKLIN
jgi:putative transferase (TIGR04331 family)